MKSFYIVIIFNLFVFSLHAFSLNEAYKERHNINFILNYNTNSRVFLHPKSSNPEMRNSYHIFDNFLSYGVEVKTNFYRNVVMLGFGVEFLKAQESLYSVRGLVNLVPRTFKVQESFYIFPLEFCAYYVFPFSGESFNAYMGAGFGVYYGEYERKIYDIKSKSKLSKIDVGILVNSGVDFKLHKNFSVKLELRFRDPELEFRNEYERLETVINGEKIQLFEKIFFTKVNVEGISILTGLSLWF